MSTFVWLFYAQVSSAIMVSNYIQQKIYIHNHFKHFKELLHQIQFCVIHRIQPFFGGGGQSIYSKTPPPAGQFKQLKIL